MGLQVAVVDLLTQDVGGAVEGVAHLLLDGVHLHVPVAPEDVGDTSDHLALGVLEILHQRAQLAMAAVGAEHRGHDRNQQDERHAPIPRAEHDECGHKHARRVGHVHHQVVVEPADFAQGAAHHVGEKFAAGMLAVKTQAETVDVPEELGAQFQDDVLADPGEDFVTTVPSPHPHDDGQEKIDHQHQTHPLKLLGAGDVFGRQDMVHQVRRGDGLEGDGDAGQRVEQDAQQQGPALLPDVGTNHLPEAGRSLGHRGYVTARLGDRNRRSEHAGTDGRGGSREMFGRVDGGRGLHG